MFFENPADLMVQVNHDSYENLNLKYPCRDHGWRYTLTSYIAGRIFFSINDIMKDWMLRILYDLGEKKLLNENRYILDVINDVGYKQKY